MVASLSNDVTRKANTKIVNRNNTDEFGATKLLINNKSTFYSIRKLKMEKNDPDECSKELHLLAYCAVRF